MKQYLQKAIENDSEFLSIIKDITKNSTVQKMKNFKQHYETSCFEHCYSASFYCYKICKKYHLDYKSAARAAMLHDLFLYDWRIRQPDRKGLHAFSHPKIACKNACELFELSEKEKDIIEKHMWPLTITFPRSIEAFILTFVDKYCALSETTEAIKSRIFFKKHLRYIYTFLNFVVINI